VALIAAGVTLLHFALAYSRVAGARPWLVFAYTTGFGYQLLNARGVLDASVAAAGARAGTSAAGVSMQAAAIVAAGASLWLFARAYLRGKREALALVIGSSVAVATLANDLAWAIGLPSTGEIGALGFAGIVAGGASTLLSRYGAASEEIERKTAEVRRRTRELRKALADLGAAEEELGRKEQLAVVGELAAVIAHEVRNPLAIMANAVAGLRKPTIGRDDQTTLLGILDEETTRLNRLVSDLLRYARPVSLQRQSVSLRELIDRGLHLARRHEAVRVEVPPEGEDARIWGDANLLRQVFENLIDNATQAMNYGGTLTIKLRPTTHEAKDGIAVDIIDTGEGMDTMVRARARDPFFTTRPSGTGLGLAIVDRIVDAHGGHFVIESRAGEGTTATVFLPASSPSEAPPAPRARARSSYPPPDMKPAKASATS
jgi:signal transduction histidine kinase